MENKTYKYKRIVVIFYLLSLLILFSLFLGRVVYKYKLNTNFKLVLLFIVCLLIYINGFILVKKLHYKNKILKVNLVIYFLIYTITIFTLTLFDEVYGRRGLIPVNWNKEMLSNYIKYSFNIIPFKTIKLYIMGYTNNIVSFHNFSINIIGNFLAFMPYGAFIPLMFKKVNKYYKFLIIMVIIVIMIELIQFITISGSCDIDDLILNVIGASIIYFIVKIKFVNNGLKKIFLFE